MVIETAGDRNILKSFKGGFRVEVQELVFGNCFIEFRGTLGELLLQFLHL